MTQDHRIAIVGMAVLLPGAPDLATYWRNLRDGVDAIGEVPPGRLEPVFFDPEARTADRFYCRRGGFVDAYATFDPGAFGIMPVAVEGAEPDQLLALRVAAEALADAGPSVRRAARERTGVILGRGGYLTAGVARLEQRVRTAQQLVECLRGLFPALGEDDLERARREFQERLGPERPESSIGLVPNLAASRIANRLDLQGPAYTVDAACASSLIAVDHAVRELAQGRCDLVVAGGVHHCHDVTFWSVFSQLRALSPSGRIRPFDSGADGILIGEGTGMAVLKRLADAERDGDRVYAVIRGCGVASDGRESSLMKPRVEGQVLALERAWQAAGCDPAGVGLIEAHGTGTPAGDKTELQTLQRFFGTPTNGGPRAGLGSVKSMIGHAMPAAGIAALVKAALAVHHGVLLPTLHCDDPHPLLKQTRFRTIAAAEPWEAKGVPRLAGINAFGFGGINAHVVIESVSAPAPARGRAVDAGVVAAPTVAEADRVALFAAADVAALLRVLEAAPAPGTDGLCAEAASGSVRLAIANPTAERLATARKVVERGRAWRGRNDIWFAPEGLAAGGGRVACLFPGVEPNFDPQVDDIAAHFGLKSGDVGARDLESQGFGIIGVGSLVHSALIEIGMPVDEIAGHSIGEWSGVIAAGMISRAEVDAFVASLQRGNLEVPDVVFAVVGCGAEQAATAIEGLEDIAVSHDNCPHQAILCGRAESIRAGRERLRAQRVMSEELPFRSGFHSPLFAPYLPPFLEYMRRLPLQPPRVRLWSATTCAPYPSEIAAIHELVEAHFVKPVRFREVVERLYAEGVRVFVQAGLGSLIHFVDDTLHGREHLGISALTARRGGMSQLRRLAAALFVEGVPLQLDRIFAGGASQGADDAAPRAHRMPQLLSLGTPLVRVDKPLSAAAAMPLAAAGPVGDPLVDELNATLRDAAEAGRAVLDAWNRMPSSRRKPSRRTAAPSSAATPATPPAPVPTQSAVALNLSVDTHPDLIDHCFYRQAAGWPDVSDRFPVVPGTTIVQMMIEAASKLQPGQVPVGVDSVRALRWLAVAPPVEVNLKARVDGAGRVKVTVEGYSSATVLFAAAYPPAPEPRSKPLRGERPAPATPQQLYNDRWMFHGPSYQGIVALGPDADDGIAGTIVSQPAPGALLDNAGQLMGYWVMLHTEINRLAFPVAIERIRFYGPQPAPGKRVDCRVWILDLGDTNVRADLELSCDGRVWACIEDWNDRRFETDEIIWPVLRYPESNLLADPDRGLPYVLVRERWLTSASRELIMRRYLDAAERREYEAMNPRAQRTWLLGRMAAKDAVRRWLFARGVETMFPAEVHVANDAAGRPVVSGRFDADLRVSIAHKDGVGVAIVREGRDPGIDVETIAPRGGRFADLALTAAERALAPARDGADEWLTRVWTAKEAVAKARGTGLNGRPQDFPVSRVEPARLRVAESWVESHREGDFIVSWTAND